MLNPLFFFVNYQLEERGGLTEGLKGAEWVASALLFSGGLCALC